MQVEAAAFLVPSERGDAGGRGARALALYRRVALAWACSPRTLGRRCKSLAGWHWTRAAMLSQVGPNGFGLG